MEMCPECKGKGIMAGIGCPGFVPISIPCSMCNATGQISDEVAGWRRRGLAMRTRRLIRNIGLREEAMRRGISPGVLSDMERGKIEPEDD